MKVLNGKLDNTGSELSSKNLVEYKLTKKELADRAATNQKRGGSKIKKKTVPNKSVLLPSAEPNNKSRDVKRMAMDQRQTEHDNVTGLRRDQKQKPKTS